MLLKHIVIKKFTVRFSYDISLVSLSSNNKYLQPVDTINHSKKEFIVLVSSNTQLHIARKISIKISVHHSDSEGGKCIKHLHLLKTNVL